MRRESPRGASNYEWRHIHADSTEAESLRAEGLITINGRKATA